MKKVILSILFMVAALSLLAARPQPNLKKFLQETNAPTLTSTLIPLDTPTPTTEFPTVEAWMSPTPPGDPYAARIGFPAWGHGPIYVTPSVRIEDLQYPMWATPCLPWIDSAGILFCVDATPIPLDTQAPPSGYP